MIEYIFFHSKPSELFGQFLTRHHICFENKIDKTDVDGYLVVLADDLDDDISEKIESYYDELLSMDESLLVEQPEDIINQAGLVVTLSNGESTFASVDPNTLNKMLTVMTRDEVADFIDAIVSAIEQPDQRSLCKR